MFFNFEVGDYLVHEKYGIGQFIGVDTLSINNTSMDFFRIKYLNDSFLLIPAYNIAVFKFHSNKHSNTAINALGSPQFLKLQKKHTLEIAKEAEDLKRIYKARESVVMPVFHLNKLYDAFCHEFPFELSVSQSKGMKEILKDLSNSRPMDRLLCGDVGFGKTELAARAMALVMSEGYKAIFVVPTTILASQHFNLLKDRFQKIGKKTCLLSKLNSKIEQDKVKWKAGHFDCLITTAHHKGIESLIIPEVALIVLDEEHHFGVKFKETIRLKAHFLQLSATPIPRTLNLALSKIKDITILDSPPTNRQAVQVHVSTLKDLNLQNLIKQECAKNGKVFLVVPRIQFIDEIIQKLSFVPFVVLHGQMSKEEMSQSLDAFVEGKINVLVATNIIESGVNVLSANLIIIFHAHMFGVAQLHQLKGRVGRAGMQASVYFVVPESLKDTSSERLSVIQTHAEVGAGYALAIKDMDVRGSGTAVGNRQSGKDYGLGLEMYYDILNECIDPTSHYNSEKKISWIGFEQAFIPKDYIVDEKIRFSFYKKLSKISSLQEISEIVEDLTLFGLIPKPLCVFIEIMKITIIARYLNIIKVKRCNTYIEIYYENIELDVFIIIQKVAKIECVLQKIVLDITQIEELITLLSSLLHK